MKTTQLKCIYTNTDNSLLNKLDELKGHLATSPFHIAAITEAKPKNGVNPEKDILAIDGYDLFLSKLEEFSRRCFFRNYLITFLNDELYAQTKVFAKKFSIFKNSGRGGLKNDDFWHFRE